MKLVPVENVPKSRNYHYLEDMIKEFLDSDYDICEVDIKEHEYKHPRYCYNALWVAAKRMGVPVKVTFRNKKTYLVKVAI